jgi:hypothetical protein
MSVRGHRDQITISLGRDSQDFRRRIAQRQMSRNLQSAGTKLRGSRFEILPVLLHLLGFRELELLIVARHPTIRDMDEQQMRMEVPRQIGDVRQETFIRAAVLQGNENFSVHRRYCAICAKSFVMPKKSSKYFTFSVTMMAAVSHASTFTHSGFANSPIFLWSLVNITSGTTANES